MEPWTRYREAPELHRTTPGHRWADGSAWKVFWGEDYYVSDKAFQTAAYAHAKSHGLVVTTRSIDGGVIIQFARRRRT